MKRKYKGYNELQVKLLPEKAKRDYLLRLISSIIIMIFVIINFFLVYLPRTHYQSQINDINRAIYFLESNYRSLYDKITFIDRDIYDVKGNNEVKKIEAKEIHLTKILFEFDNIKPNHSFIENVTYDESSYKIVLSAQFDTLFDLSQYQDDLLEINYVVEVNVGNSTPSPMPDGATRFITSYVIILNIENAPKVGDLLE